MITSKIKNTILARRMIEGGDNVLVGLSGGADSVCLLCVLNELKDEFGITLSAAHLNHGLRGDEADGDQQFCAELCDRLGVKFYSKKVELNADGETVEVAGRKARYDYFAELKAEFDFDKIATAHHADDQAETVLMRIMRGTGISGLSGIQYVRGDGVIRPLLDVERREIEAYCRENALAFRTDNTNSDTAFTRNRIRVELLPYLEVSFNPNVREALCRLVSTAGEDGEFLENYAKRLYKRLKNPLPTSEVCLHIPSVMLAERPIVVRLLRIAAEDALGVFPQLEQKHIDDILKLMNECKSGTSLDLPNDLRVSVNYDWLTFSKQSEVQMFGDFYLEIEPNQTYEVKKYGVKINTKKIKINEKKIKTNESLIDFNKLTDKIGDKKLILRKRRDGDRMVVYSDGRTKKINDIFTDMKISRFHRDRQLILAVSNEGPVNVPAVGSANPLDGLRQKDLNNGEVIAILGLRVSEEYKVDKDTTEGLLITYESIDDL